MNFDINKLILSQSEAIPDTNMDLISNIINEARTQIARSYDDLMFTMLYPYGIDRFNWKEQINRVVITRQSGMYRHVFVDGVYAFTIEEGTEYFTEWEKESCYAAKVNIRVKIIEEMKGMGLDENYI